MELLMELPDATGNGKTKMAARKLEMRLLQLVHKIAMKLRRLRQYFWNLAIQYGNSVNVVRCQCCTTEREVTGSVKSKMAACKLETRISHLLHKIAMKF